VPRPNDEGRPRRFPESYVNKTTRLKFQGLDLEFLLSHALFSSFEVDAGTKLLLKTLAQRVDLDSVRTVLDEGTGTGVIGVAIGARYPEANVLCRDRDALALAFTEANWRLATGSDPKADAGPNLRFRTEGGLLGLGLEDRNFDLVASNVPAKAGNPVLERFFMDGARD
jgi:16S rRNA G1207 methylase RsmC